MLSLGLYLKIALTSGFALFAILFSFFLIRWLIGVLRVEADQIKALKLVNRGNCACQYHLSVSTTAPNLKFSLFADGVPLAPVYEEIYEDIIEEGPETPAKGKEKSQPAVVAATPAKAVPQEAAKTEKVNADGALKAGQQAGAKSGVVANLLGTVGSILPGSLGSGAKNAAGKAREAQSVSAKAVQAPKVAQRKMDAVKTSENRLGIKGGDAQESGFANTNARGRQMRSKREQAEVSRVPRRRVKKKKKLVEKVGVVQTIDLAPGQFLFLSLEITKEGKRYPSGSYAYSLEAQPVPLDKQFGTAPAMVKKKQVYFAPIGRWRYWIPSISVILYLLLLTLSAYYLLWFIWA